MSVAAVPHWSDAPLEEWPVPLSANAYLLARGSVARRLIRAGQLAPDVALSYVVWPTEDVLAAERACPKGTTVHRAYGMRGNE